MKLVCFSDIHGSYERVDEILSREQKAEAIIIAGDLTTNGSPGEAEEALALFLRHGKPMFIVAGNMDPLPLEASFSKHATLINGMGVLIADVGIFGVSGSPPTPFNTPYEISEEEIFRRALSGWDQVQQARVKVFVPHPPPFNTACDRTNSGKHVGSSSVRKFIEEFKPDACVCGHIHESRGTDTIGTTQIVNCGPAGKGYYAVVSIGETVTVETRG